MEKERKKDNIPHFIAGQTVLGGDERCGAIYDPARGRVVGRVSFASAMEVERTIAAAQQAFAGWAGTPVPRRVRILFRFKELVEQNIDALAALITREHGKILSDARASLGRGLEVVEFACGAPHLLTGTFSENVSGGIDTHALRQPLGVCVGISPFNFPAMVPLWMFPIAIAAGNTFVLKPSEKDPSCALRLAQLFAEAGLPPGVLNVIHGDSETVRALITDPRVAALSFVGSTAVAKSVYETAASHGLRVQALGGAKNHLVVLPDADLDQAVDALMGAAYGSAGERCMAISVAVAVGNIADELVGRLQARVEALRMGPGDQPGVEMGPLITREHLEKVRRCVDSGVAQGAALRVDGRQLRVSGHEEGFFMGGCLFDHVTTAMDIYRGEIFGPVLCVVRVPDLSAALEMINAHLYGNGAAIFTREGAAARTFASQVQAGMVGINVPIPAPAAFHSFGGWKASSFGDHGMYGCEGFRFYTQLKTITSRWPSGGGGAIFHMPTS